MRLKLVVIYSSIMYPSVTYIYLKHTNSLTHLSLICSSLLSLNRLSPSGHLLHMLDHFVDEALNWMRFLNVCPWRPISCNVHYLTILRYFLIKKNTFFCKILQTNMWI